MLPLRAPMLMSLVLLAGCVPMTIANVGSPTDPGAPPKAKSTPMPSRAEDLVGIWAGTAGANTKGPLKVHACSSLRTHTFKLAEDGEGLTLDCDNYRSTPVVPYNFERLTGKRDADDPRTWRFEGYQREPVGDGSTTKDVPISYVLVHDPARLTLTGTVSYPGRADRKILLVKTEYETNGPCGPLSTPRPTFTASPSPTPSASPTPEQAEGQ